MVNKINIAKHIVILACLSYIAFFFASGTLDLTNMDEVFYAQTAKEMVQHNTWLTPYLFGHPQFEKPVLTYWLLRAAIILFGVSNFGMRFFPALFALIGVITVYFLGLAVFRDRTKAFVSALILLSSALYIGMARVLMTDMIFSIFIFLSLAAFFRGYVSDKEKPWGIILFFIFSAFAVLTKGPLGFTMPFLTVAVFLIIRKDLKFLSNRYFYQGLLIFLLIALPWYIIMLRRYGHTFSHEFFYNDHLRRFLEAEHPDNDRWYFYPFTAIFGMFPWALFLSASLIILCRRIFRRKASVFQVFLAVWIAVVFLNFQVCHSKLVSYILPMFPALALITADMMPDILDKGRNKRLFIGLLSAVLFIFLLVPPAITIIMTKYSSYIPSRIPLYFLSVEFLLLPSLAMFFIIRNKPALNVYVLAVALPLMGCVLPYAEDYIRLYRSSQAACQYLIKNQSEAAIILCSKIFARGVRYHTNKDVAVISIPGTQFFSPHPIPFLGSDKELKAFLSKRAVTFCILKKGSLEDIERVAGTTLKYSVLNMIGNEYIVKVERL